MAVERRQKTVRQQSLKPYMPTDEVVGQSLFQRRLFRGDLSLHTKNGCCRRSIKDEFVCLLLDVSQEQDI